MIRSHIIGLVFIASVSLYHSNGAIADNYNENVDLNFNEAIAAIHTKDFRKALRIFKVLANEDVADAQFNLAVLIKAGMGQPRNFSEAYFWAVLSSLGGEIRSKPLVDELKELLPPEEVDLIHSRILTRLATQLSSGEQSAIVKFARIQSDFLTNPDYETAYVWYSIAQALGIEGGYSGSKESASHLDAVDLVNAQKKSNEVFEGSAFFE